MALGRLDRLKIAGEDGRPALLLAQENELAGLCDGLHVEGRKPAQPRPGTVRGGHNRNAEVEQRQHLRFRVRARRAHEVGIGALVALALQAGLGADFGRYQWLVHEAAPPEKFLHGA